MSKKIIGKALKFYETYDTRIGLSFMALGFIVDNLTLKRVDQLFDVVILFFYLTIALVTILLINSYESGKLQYSYMVKLHPWLFLPMQYAFGALFSGFVVFYTRSATLVTSWPFLVVLVALLVGNEFSKNKYTQFTYHITIFYVALFSFAIIYVPVLMNQIGAAIFVLSGIISLVVMVFLLLIIRSLSRDRFRKRQKSIITAIASVFILFNLAYFTNIIPPIPLSLKAIGLYHHMTVRDGVYVAETEPDIPHQLFRQSAVFHRYAKEPIYVFSAIFAPTDIATRIYHQWYWYDNTTSRWVARDRLSFAIVGGRNDGYRGYSKKQNVTAGRWRVDVVTNRNQLVGRIEFAVKEVTTPPTTSSVVL